MKFRPWIITSIVLTLFFTFPPSSMAKGGSKGSRTQGTPITTSQTSSFTRTRSPSQQPLLVQGTSATLSERPKISAKEDRQSRREIEKAGAQLSEVSVTMNHCQETETLREGLNRVKCNQIRAEYKKRGNGMSFYNFIKKEQKDIYSVIEALRAQNAYPNKNSVADVRKAAAAKLGTDYFENYSVGIEPYSPETCRQGNLDDLLNRDGLKYLKELKEPIQNRDLQCDHGPWQPLQIPPLKLSNGQDYDPIDERQRAVEFVTDTYIKDIKKAELDYNKKVQEMKIHAAKTERMVRDNIARGDSREASIQRAPLSDSQRNSNRATLPGREQVEQGHLQEEAQVLQNKIDRLRAEHQAFLSKIKQTTPGFDVGDLFRTSSVLSRDSIEVSITDPKAKMRIPVQTIEDSLSKLQDADKNFMDDYNKIKKQKERKDKNPFLNLSKKWTENREHAFLKEYERMCWFKEDYLPAMKMKQEIRKRIHKCKKDGKAPTGNLLKALTDIERVLSNLPSPSMLACLDSSSDDHLSTLGGNLNSIVSHIDPDQSRDLPTHTSQGCVDESRKTASRSSKELGGTDSLDGRKTKTGTAGIADQ